ncbi:hypothetical protein [Ramlibacter montanisoli]|uniref:Uncharacterized protein n=1 Tax=Ramlibacter montanisoli TaxID=2732512 RepID=A0A849K789_9BURK|nr:hypothetical protein [Ramlibacter montanisoli]NNU44252.1 hypothetical protein [Ramlibacter montanisoli]
MLLAANVRVDDHVIGPELRKRVVEAVSWMPMHFLNRWERFRSHELDMHWYYPVAFSDEPYSADVEPDLQGLDPSLQPITECWEAIKATFDHGVRLYECMLSANTFGTEGRVHQDIAAEAERSGHITVLVYCNREWNVAWAGRPCSSTRTTRSRRR